MLVVTFEPLAQEAGASAAMTISDVDCKTFENYQVAANASPRSTPDLARVSLLDGRRQPVHATRILVPGAGSVSVISSALEDPGLKDPLGGIPRGCQSVRRSGERVSRPS
jgi:hypothetical protein